MPAVVVCATESKGAFAMTTADSLELTSRDRILVLAPHPDDESIACGGLLLAARDAGAERSVIVVTDGDNNPWPQRWIEKRWRIDAAARARWGARRRAEAGTALDVLGVAPSQRHFLGLPDSELTALLMRDARLPSEVGTLIAQMRPTHIAMPALSDRHPDHSAVHVAALLALSTTPHAPRLLIYAVHGETAGKGDVLLCLSDEQQCAKHSAIAAHRTQVRLSGKRFLRFARGDEHYEAPSVKPRGDLPLRAALTPGGLEIRVEPDRLRDPPRTLRLCVVIEQPGRESLRRYIPLVDAAGRADLQWPGDGREPASLTWKKEGRTLVTRVAVDVGPGAIAFVKLEKSRRGLVIYDRYGWQAVENSTAKLGQI